MRSFGISTFAAVALIPMSALAQDKGWAGFYGGANLGAAINSATFDTTAGITSSGTGGGSANTAAGMQRAATSNITGHDTSFEGGGQIGFNFLVAPQWYVGIEADINYLGSGRSTSTTNSAPPPGFTGGSFVTTSSLESRLSYLGTVRGRVGYAATPALMLFASGGLAFGRASMNAAYTQTGVFVDPNACGGPCTPPPELKSSASASGTLTGFAVGGGAEWMFASRWSLGLEYLYYNLGSLRADGKPMSFDVGLVNFPGFGVVGVAPSTQTDFAGSDIRLRLNYHF